MGLRFSGFSLGVIEFAHERSGITTFPPGLGKIRGHGPRGSSHLIREGITLLWRKDLGQLEHTHGHIDRLLPHFQFTKRPNCFHLRVSASPRLRVFFSGDAPSRVVGSLSCTPRLYSRRGPARPPAGHPWCRRRAYCRWATLPPRTAACSSPPRP